MRVRLAGVVALMAVAIVASHAQEMDRYMECSTNQYMAPEQRLRICTAVIDSGQIPPHNLAVAFDTRGNVHLGKSDYDGAIADFDQAIKLDPEFAGFFNDRGSAYTKKGQFDRAIADFDQALKLRSSFYFSLYGRGLAYQGKGEIDRAIGDYDEAIGLYPNTAKPSTAEAIPIERKATSRGPSPTTIRPSRCAPILEPHSPAAARLPEQRPA